MNYVLLFKITSQNKCMQCMHIAHHPRSFYTYGHVKKTQPCMQKLKRLTITKAKNTKATRTQTEHQQQNSNNSIISLLYIVC